MYGDLEQWVYVILICCGIVILLERERKKGLKE